MTDRATRNDDVLTRDDLLMCLESLEITSQELDRPEPGTAERIQALQLKLWHIYRAVSEPETFNTRQATMHRHTDDGTTVEHRHIGGNLPHGMYDHDQDYAYPPDDPREYEVIG